MHFTFGIPRGSDGKNGNDGAPGQVTNADLNSAISDTSNNTNGVISLGSSFSDSDMDALRQKINGLINTLRR